MNKVLFVLVSLAIAFPFLGCTSNTDTSKITSQSNSDTVVEEKKEMSNKAKAVELLESLESGDQKPIAYINSDKYIQHNPMVADGLEGFGELMKSKPPEGFKANVLRAFEDGDYVFTHTKYDFFGVKSGIDIFRFEDGLIVEHWDNLLDEQPLNASGRSQFDGATKVQDTDQTEVNRKVVQDFYEVVIIGGQFQRMGEFFDGDKYIQHNPMLGDGVSGFQNAVKKMKEQGVLMKLEKLHMLLADGNFVLGVAEGTFAQKPYAFYDLFRLEGGKLAEHWDVMAEIPPKVEWRNDNGKF